MIAKLQARMEYEIQILDTKCFVVLIIKCVHKPGIWKNS